MTILQNCGLYLNQTNDGKGATELSMTKHDWGQLKAGVPFQEYISCHNDAVTCDKQNKLLMKSLHLVCQRRRRRRWWRKRRRKMLLEKVNLQQYFYWYWRASPLSENTPKFKV
jgi:hypothetical protein